MIAAWCAARPAGRTPSYVVATAMLTVALIATSARRADGQALRGTVRDSTSNRPIAGAVVTTLDSLGRVGRRSLTDERGAFLVTAPPAARRLRVVRLGFRPVDVAIPLQRDTEMQLAIVMTQIPYSLQAVRVQSGASCPRRSDRTAALALLEQARAGLLATVVARAEKPAPMKRLLIDRRLDAASGRVTRHRVRIELASSALAAFGAAHGAADFVRRGFAADSGEGTTFYAPDADVLLDDGFAEGYCFHIMDRERTRRSQVGLGFRAVDRRRGRIDVDGALWIDTVARTLVDIEYRYVGLARELSRLEPGGRVAFRELANGVVLIDRWMLRLAGTESEPSQTDRRPNGPPPRATFIIGEAGGELARATWPDGFTWVASLGTLALSVTDGQGKPRGETAVRLDDTDYEATTDSTGRLEIVDLVPGPYSATIVDPRLETIGVQLATPLSFVAARDATVPITLEAPTAEDFVADRCRKKRRQWGFTVRAPSATSGWIVGRVTGPNAEPLAGVVVTMSTPGATNRPASATYTTGTDGLFVECDFGRDAAVSIAFRKQGMATGTITRVLTDPLNVIAAQMTAEPARR